MEKGYTFRLADRNSLNLLVNDVFDVVMHTEVCPAFVGLQVKRNL